MSDQRKYNNNNQGGGRGNDYGGRGSGRHNGRHNGRHSGRYTVGPNANVARVEPTNSRAILLSSSSSTTTGARPSLPLPGFRSSNPMPPPAEEPIDTSKSVITSTIGDGKYVPPALKSGNTVPENLPVFTPSSAPSHQKGGGHYTNQNKGGNWASAVERNKTNSHNDPNNKKKNYGVSWNEYEEQKKKSDNFGISDLTLKEKNDDMTSSNIDTTTTTKNLGISTANSSEISPDVEKARFERHIVRAEQLEGTVHSEIRNITRKADTIYKELCLNGLKSGATNLYSAVIELSNIYIDDLITSPGTALQLDFAKKFVVLRNSILDLYLSVFGSQNISDSINVSSPQDTTQTIKIFLAELNSYADYLANIIVGLKAAPNNVRNIANETIRDLLMVLGDIAVYAEKYRLDTRTPLDWTFAMTYYGEAASMLPVNGNILKSFSSISQTDGNNFDTAYLLFRSMQTKSPYQARETLLGVFEEVKMRTEKIDTTTNNFSNFTFQDHRLKFRSSFLTSIGIAFSRVDSEKFVTSVDRCRIHLEAMMKLLSAEVKKSKTNDNANDGTQIFESEKTVASLTEVGGCNIFKYISIIDEDIFKCIVMLLTLLQNIIDKNSLATRMASAKYINTTGENVQGDAVIEKFLVQFLHSIKCIQGLVETTQLLIKLVTAMTGYSNSTDDNDNGLGLHTVAATSRGLSLFLRWLVTNHEVCIFSIIDKTSWETMEKALGSYLSIMNTSRVASSLQSSSVQEDHDLFTFLPLKSLIIESAYTNNNYLCSWGASRGFALDYKSVAIRVARCEESVKILSSSNLLISSSIGNIAFNTSKVGVPSDLSELNLITPTSIMNQEKLKKLMISYQPSTVEDTTLLTSSRATSSTAARLITSSSSTTSTRPKGSRPVIVLDATNLAKYRGDSMPASCKGIKQAIQYYIKGGYKVMTFLPSAFLRSDKLAEVNRLMKLKIGEQGQCEVPNDTYMLNDFIKEGMVKGVTVNEYNEAYCLVYARKNDAVLISNDNFREHVKKIEGMQEREEVRAWIRTSTVAYQFQGDYFKPNPINF